MPWKYGVAERVWVMDRGMVSEQNLAFLRQRKARYLVGTPKSWLRAHEQTLLEQSDWKTVQDGLEVRLVEQPGSEPGPLSHWPGGCARVRGGGSRLVPCPGPGRSATVVPRIASRGDAGREGRDGVRAGLNAGADPAGWESAAVGRERTAAAPQFTRTLMRTLEGPPCWRSGWG